MAAANRATVGLWAWIALLLLAAALYLPGINWGLPAVSSWSQDTIAGQRTLGAVEGWPRQWAGRYPPLHYLVLRACYETVLRHWRATGQVISNESGSIEFAPPHAPKMGRLFLIARLVSVVMALAGGVAMMLAVRELGASVLAGFLAAVALMIGADFAYFARLGNVDVPSICWLAWSVYFYARLLRSRRVMDAAMLGLFGSLAISTKDSVAGAYPGIALALLIFEWRAQRHSLAREGDFAVPADIQTPHATVRRVSTWAALGRAVMRPRWLAGLALFVFPYLFINGVFWNPEGYSRRMEYWLGFTSGTLHAAEHRYDSSWSLLLASLYHGAGGVGWPMLATMILAKLYLIWRRRAVALALALPVVSYHLIVVHRIDYVYARILFPIIVFLAIATGIAAADWLRARRVPWTIRVAALLLVAAPSLGYALSVSAGMRNDSRYAVEAWFREHVPLSASVGAFCKPQYLPRLSEAGYATYLVEMTPEAFQRPQPDYLVLSEFDYQDYDAARLACQRDLVDGLLGYRVAARFEGGAMRRHWLSVAGWGAPPVGKISPEIVVLIRDGQ